MDDFLKNRQMSEVRKERGLFIAAASLFVVLFTPLPSVAPKIKQVEYVRDLTEKLHSKGIFNKSLKLNK